MLVLGLTGGIGAGKTTVAQMLADRGALVIDVDQVGRDVIAPGGRARDAVLARFGTADRAELATVVFGDPAALEALEAISHPAINRELEARLRSLPGDAVVVLDMAVLTESDLGKLPDGRGYEQVIVVEAPTETRLARLEARGVATEQARARMAAQASDEARRAIADFVLVNDGDLADLDAQVDAVWRAVTDRST